MPVAAGAPVVSVAHVTLHTRCMRESIEFMKAVGMQMVFEGSDVSILELRGGTHLLLFPCETSPCAEASFDLMVDDLHALHRKLAKLGYTLSPIVERPEIGHECFDVAEPSGSRITCFSNHSTCEPR